MKTKQENDYVLALQYRTAQLENALAEILVEVKKGWTSDNEGRIAKAWANGNLILNGNKL